MLNLHSRRYALLLPLRCDDCRRRRWVFERWMTQGGVRFATGLLCEDCAAERVAQTWFVLSVVGAQDQTSRCSASAAHQRASAAHTRGGTAVKSACAGPA